MRPDYNYRQSKLEWGCNDSQSYIIVAITITRKEFQPAQQPPVGFKENPGIPCREKREERQKEKEKSVSAKARSEAVM